LCKRKGGALVALDKRPELCGLDLDRCELLAQLGGLDLPCGELCAHLVKLLPRFQGLAPPPERILLGLVRELVRLVERAGLCCDGGGLTFQGDPEGDQSGGELAGLVELPYPLPCPWLLAVVRGLDRHPLDLDCARRHVQGKV